DLSRTEASLSAAGQKRALALSVECLLPPAADIQAHGLCERMPEAVIHGLSLETPGRCAIKALKDSQREVHLQRSHDLRQSSSRVFLSLPRKHTCHQVRSTACPRSFAIC